MNSPEIEFRDSLKSHSIPWTFFSVFFRSVYGLFVFFGTAVFCTVRMKAIWLICMNQLNGACTQNMKIVMWCDDYSNWHANNTTNTIISRVCVYIRTCISEWRECESYYFIRWVFKLALRLLPRRKKEHKYEDYTLRSPHDYRYTVNLTHLKFQSTENVWLWSENSTNELIKWRTDKER